MNRDELFHQAKKLAARSYRITIEEDVLTNGEHVFVLAHPELPGCKAQGYTLTEAQIALDEARLYYIEALLEVGLEIPSPGGHFAAAASTSNSQVYIFNFVEGTQDKSNLNGADELSSAETAPLSAYILEGDLEPK
jgi:predicted RNase H-like HicB family nuclease